MATDAAAVKRMAALLRGGRAGEALARRLVRAGICTRPALLKSPALDWLPVEARANVRFRPVRSMPLAKADEIASEIARRLTWSRPEFARARVIAVGSVRRRALRVADIDLLAVVAPGPGRAAPPPEFLREATLRPARRGDSLAFVDTYSDGARHRALIVRSVKGRGPVRHYRLDLFAATPAEEPFALFHYTGPAAYNIRTRALAKKKGWRLNQYGLFHAASGRPVAGMDQIRTEADLAARLGVTHRAPSAR